MAWWVEPAVVFGIALVAALVVRYLLLRVLERRNVFSGVFAATVRFPSVLWSLAAALAVAVEYTDLPRKYAGRTSLWIGAFVIISLTLVAASVAVRMLSQYGERQGMPFAAAGLSRALIRVLVFALGAAWLLAHFERWKGITPLLTALGVGGIAVALALQDTLANFFAGIHILVERPIVVGDSIRLESGQEGVVTDIGWRTTRVRTGGNDMVVAPNTKITSGILVNYSLPERRTTAEVQILVSHKADAEQVRRIALEEAARVEGVLADPAPLFLCDPGVLPTHLRCKLVVQIADRSALGRIQSEIRTRLLARFRDEGVPLPEYFSVSR
jgi:small-conductance mechanosensitive channel